MILYQRFPKKKTKYSSDNVRQFDVLLGEGKDRGPHRGESKTFFKVNQIIIYKKKTKITESKICSIQLGICQSFLHHLQINTINKNKEN